MLARLKKQRCNNKQYTKNLRKIFSILYIKLINVI